MMDPDQRLCRRDPTAQILQYITRTDLSSGLLWAQSSWHALRAFTVSRLCVCGVTYPLASARRPRTGSPSRLPRGSRRTAAGNRVSGSTAPPLPRSETDLTSPPGWITTTDPAMRSGHPLGFAVHRVAVTIYDGAEPPRRERSPTAQYWRRGRALSRNALSLSATDYPALAGHSPMRRPDDVAWMVAVCPPGMPETVEVTSLENSVEA